MDFIKKEFANIAKQMASDTNFLIAQILSIIALIFGVIAFQCKRHKYILFSKGTSEVFGCIHYLFLSVYTGMAFSAISVVRNFTFAFLVKNKKNTLPFQIGFSLFYIVIGITTWEGILGLMVIVAKVLSCISYGISKEKHVRALNAPAMVMWIIYNAVHKSIGGTISDSLSFMSIVIGIIRYDILKQEKKSVDITKKSENKNIN